MSEVIEVNDVGELAGYRLLWTSLLPQTPRASFFHTLDWLETYWRHFGEEQKLRVLVAHAGGQPIGIVPLCVRRQTYRVGRVRVLGFPLDDWGCWYSAIGPNQAATMMLAMQHIRRTRRDWDLISLDWNGPSDSDHGRPGRALRIAGFSPDKQPCHQNSIVETTGGWEQYLAGRSTKVRQEIRRKLRRLDHRDDVEYVRLRPLSACCGDGDPGWDVYDECEQVAGASWQADRADGNTLSSPRVRQFLRDAHTVAARLGMVDVNVLRVGGEPAAFCYNYHFAGQLRGLRIGYAPRFRGMGAGNGLLLQLIRDSFHRQDAELDLGQGDFRYKRELRTRAALGYRLTHAPWASWRSQAVRIAQWAKARRYEPADAPSQRASA